MFQNLPFENFWNWNQKLLNSANPKSCGMAEECAYRWTFLELEHSVALEETIESPNVRQLNAR